MKLVLGNWHLNAGIWHFKCRHLAFMKLTPDSFNKLEFLAQAGKHCFDPSYLEGASILKKTLNVSVSVSKKINYDLIVARKHDKTLIIIKYDCKV